MSLAILFHFLCAQHVSDINISIIRSLRLFCSITILVVLFLVRCVLEIRCGWVGVISVLQASAEACNTDMDEYFSGDGKRSCQWCWYFSRTTNVSNGIQSHFYTFMAQFFAWGQFYLYCHASACKGHLSTGQHNKNHLPSPKPLYQYDTAAKLYTPSCSSM